MSTSPATSTNTRRNAGDSNSQPVNRRIGVGQKRAARASAASSRRQEVGMFVAFISAIKP
jgi:hypothetical protein